MGPSVLTWLVLAGCALAVAAESQDNVLRFLSQEDVARMAKKTKEQTDDIIVVRGDSSSGQPMEKAGSAAVSSLVKSVVCPGGKSECPDGSTCCQLQSGDYGCCPKANAVCCSDHIHCCPESYTCDVAGGKCNPPSGELFLPWETKKPAVSRVSGSAVVCPGGQTQCADGQTCCQLASGNYGCCPFPEAVCCSDHAHCCPKGLKCNLKAQTCDDGTHSVPWLVKQPSSPRLSSTVLCPDKQSQCTTDQTCCKNAAGGYGCCPSPNATCCNDLVHCCPQGYTCDVVTKTCNKGPQSLSLVTQKQSSVR